MNSLEHTAAGGITHVPTISALVFRGLLVGLAERLETFVRVTDYAFLFHVRILSLLFTENIVANYMWKVNTYFYKSSGKALLFLTVPSGFSLPLQRVIKVRE